MSNEAPVSLTLDQESGAQFLIYSDSKGVSVDIRFDGEALWMTQAQIAELFGRDVSVISRHITNIFEEGELDGNHLHKMQMNPRGGPSALYSLDMIISVGYRVSSGQATLFRRWATDKLVQFATKGFVIDTFRLKSPDHRDRIAELREIIRDIRSDEANIYRELRQICAMCQDYDPRSDQWTSFYRNTQAKLVFAVTSKTPAELIRLRANAGLDNMGLTNWPNENIRKADVSVSKNYLAPNEIRELNRLSTILLDILEDQMDIGRLKTMDEASTVLDRNLDSLGRVVLKGGGGTSHDQAIDHAHKEYERFKAKLKTARHAKADAHIADLKRQSAGLPKK